MKLTRHEFLASLGAVAAVPLDALAQAPAKAAPPPGATKPPPPPGPKNRSQQAAIDAAGTLSFAQSGEDLIANFIFHYLQIPKITYMDVGAHDPVAVNNTYFFYRSGLSPRSRTWTWARTIRWR